jgi:signal peptidase I
MKIAQAPRFSYRAWRLVFVGIVLVVVGLVFRAHYRLAIVSGTSMLPTLKPGDVLLIDKRAYRQFEPRRGDIVVAQSSAGLVVKRVVGLPGEDVGVQKGRLYVNGGLMTEQHKIQPGWLDVGTGTLLAGDFATLGDNRAIAAALAVHPIVTKADMLGKVVLALGRHIR